MIDRERRLLPSQHLLLVFLVLASWTTARSGATQIQWYASLYAQDSSWIQVMVDTRGLDANAVADDVEVSIGLYDADDDLLGGQTFNFTAATQTRLVSGNVYQQFFQNPIPAAAAARGFSLKSSLDTVGHEFMAVPITSGTGAVTFRPVIGRPPLASAPTVANVISINSVPQATVASQATTKTYVFPGGGKRNNNESIGPFCCTGETATVNNASGLVVGYIYFFDFDGGQTLRNGHSGTSTIKIDLSGGAGVDGPSAGSLQSAAVFTANDWRPGMSRTVSVGQLTYIVSLERADIVLVNGTRLFDMASPRVVVRVSGL